MASCLDKLTDEEKNHLVSSVYGKRHLFWVGSGFSCNFHYPTWEDVLNKTKLNIKYPHDLPQNLLHAAEVLHSFYDEENCAEDDSVEESKKLEEQFNQEILNALQELFNENAAGNETDPDWVDEFVKLSPDMIVTTNWDGVLERIIDPTPNVIIRDDPSPRISKSKNILKIHGDSSRASSIVVTQSQYTRFQREDTYLKSKVFTLFSEYVPVFIGYSLTDPNIFYIYDEYVANIGKNRPPAFMVVHPSKKKKEFEQAKHLFAKKNICLIEASIGSFLGALAIEQANYEGTKHFFEDKYASILALARPLIDGAINSVPPKKKSIEAFNTDELRVAGVQAMMDLLRTPQIYEEYEGTLLSPSGSIPFKEARSLFQGIIQIINSYKEEKLSTEDEAFILGAILKNCKNNPKLWDFNEAKIAFEDLLSFSVSKESVHYAERIELIKEMLDWGSLTHEFGKCWSIGISLKKEKDFFSAFEIESLVSLVKTEQDNEISIRKSSWWLKELKSAKKIIKKSKKDIDSLLAGK